MLLFCGNTNNFLILKDENLELVSEDLPSSGLRELLT